MLVIVVAGGGWSVLIQSHLLYPHPCRHPPVHLARHPRGKEAKVLVHLLAAVLRIPGSLEGRLVEAVRVAVGIVERCAYEEGEDGEGVAEGVARVER